jgi:hypothetical protein
MITKVEIKKSGKEKSPLHFKPRNLRDEHALQKVNKANAISSDTISITGGKDEGTDHSFFASEIFQKLKGIVYLGKK